MGKWIMALLGLLLTGLLGWWPFPQMDTGELYIVKTLLVERTEDRVCLTAGTVTGQGNTVAAARADLEEQAPGQLFLRQTSRVILCRGAEAEDVFELREDLPMGAYLYMYRGTGESLDLETLEPVLEAREHRHPELPTLAAVENRLLTGREPAPAELEVSDES